MAVILKGDSVVSALGEKMKKGIEHIKARDVTPTLAILRIGDKPDDISYERNVIRRSESIGINVKSIVLAETIAQDSLIENIQALNNDVEIHGVLMFRPLPIHLNEREACSTLVASKDIDGITMHSLAGVFTGSNEGFAPCTAQAVLEILDFYDIDCTSKNIVIVGRSLVVGKPAAMMLIGRNATVTICHTKTVDLPSITSKADIVIAATGQAEGLTGEHFSPGQVVIDVGINWNEAKGKLCGDIKFEEVEPIVEAITPVPGGVGTVTTSVLLSNVVKAAKLAVS
jgi:methylenetetrahydrofolate dehydrogenase (NADP+)/methenyltetrahydrofolate cyclohydrolase